MASRSDHESKRNSTEDDESRLSASPSDDSRQRLLEDAHFDYPEKSGHYRSEDDDDDYKEGFINRWWKLVLLLLVLTSCLPLAIQLAMKWQPATEPQTPHEWRRSPDDYMLGLDWDFDAPPQDRQYTWTVRDADINPDGVYRPMMTINDQYPGPVIRANEGDNIKVTVINNAANATSFHWHGIYQNGTNHMDGTVGVTQCPIAPGTSFDYQFTVQGQSGTYWYHGHYGMQAADGLFGPLIIHSKQEKSLQKIPYDTDRIIMVSDHYHDLSGALMPQYLAPDRENVEPVPDTALINGWGTRNCSTVPHRRCNSTNAAVPDVYLRPGQHHRLRIINTGTFAEMQFQIDEHELSVTEVDGTAVLPIAYHRINIHPAQRYSVVVHANVTSSYRFWMRARMIPTCFKASNPYLIADVVAVVHYTPKPPSSAASLSRREQEMSSDWPEALELECRDLNTTELVPVEPMQAPPADAFYYIRANFEIGAHRLSRGFFNTSTWHLDNRSPTLHRAIDGFSSSDTSFLAPEDSVSPLSFVNKAAFPEEFTIQTTGIQTVDILIHSFDDGSHPFHLHGYKFFVLAEGHGSPPRLDRFRAPSDLANLRPLYDSLDASNPLRRDTVAVQAYGWALLRVVADNPGAWALHCHIGWHAEAGLMMQLVTRADGLEGLRVPSAHRDMCRAAGIEKGAGPREVDLVGGPRRWTSSVGSEMMEAGMAGETAVIVARRNDRGEPFWSKKFFAFALI